MERIKHIGDIANKILNCILNFAPELRDHHAIKVISDITPGLEAIVDAISWWSEYQEKKAVPKKAIALVCRQIGISNSKCQAIQSPEQLKTVLVERGVENPEKVFEQTLNRLFSELKYPELTQFLVDQQSTLLGELEQQFKAFKVALQGDYRYLLPLEKVLETLPVTDGTREPRFFRRIGPLAVDFDAGCVYRRPEVDQVKERLDKEGALLVMGRAASGKSVVARQVVYELWQEGRTVYLLSLTPGLQRAALQGELERLGNDGNVVVIEDAHLAPKEINRLLEFAQTGWPKLLLTSRSIDYETLFYKESNRLKELPQVELQPLDTATAISQIFCNEHDIDLAPELMRAVSDTSQDNLWLLAYSLEALKYGGWAAVDQKFILVQVERDLKKIWIDNDRNDLYPKLLVALSVLYRSETPTDACFLEDAFPGARRVLADLSDLGEVIQKEGTLYGLPHSALAELYYLFATQSEWEDPLYRDTGSFLRRYLLSDDAGNALDVIFAKNTDLLIQALQVAEMTGLARRIVASENILHTAYAINQIQRIDPVKGQALWEVLDMSCLVSRIETIKDLDITGRTISMIELADPTKGRAVIDALDVPRLARCIEAGEDPLDAAKFIRFIQEIDPVKGQTLWQALDVPRLARYLEREAAKNSLEAAEAIHMVQMADQATGKALIRIMRDSPNKPVWLDHLHGSEEDK